MVSIVATLCVVMGAQSIVLESPLPVWDAMSEDVNGDGLGDVVLLASDDTREPPVKWLFVYLGNAEGEYLTKSPLSLNLGEEAGTAFFAETDGAAPRELVAVHNDGATIYRFTGNEFVAAGEEKFLSLLPTGGKEPVFFNEAAHDLDGDGIDEWLVPTSTGYEIHFLSREAVRISCSVESVVKRRGRLEITHRIPSFYVFDAPGGGGKAIALLGEEAVDFFYGKDWTGHTRFLLPLDSEKYRDPSVVIRDIDGNGYPDIIVTQYRGSASVKAYMEVYFGTEAYTYPAEAAVSFKADGIIAEPIVRDMDNDGKLDVLVLGVPFSMRNLLNYLTRGKVSVKAELYHYDKGFKKKPTYKAYLTVDAPDSREAVAYAFGDFTGDGLVDVAYGQGENSIQILGGDKEVFLSQKAWMTLNIPVFGTLRDVDLNRSGGRDLLMFHPHSEDDTRVDVVLF